MTATIRGTLDFFYIFFNKLWTIFELFDKLNSKRGARSTWLQQ